MPVSENRIRLDSVFPSLSPEKHYICEVNDKPHINMEHNILIPLLLTLGAGLATGIGSAIALFARRTNKRLLSFSLGLSGGVMIYVSFVELFQQAQITLSEEWGAHTGIIVTVVSFFAGILLIGVIDRLVPSFENPHEAHMVEEMDKQPRNPKLMRMGMMMVLMIAITFLAPYIGPTASGIASTFPYMALTMAVFSQIQGGPDNARRAMHGLMLGMYSGLVFNLVVWALAAEDRLLIAYAAATAAALAAQGVVLALTLKKTA